MSFVIRYWLFETDVKGQARVGHFLANHLLVLTASHFCFIITKQQQQQPPCGGVSVCVRTKEAAPCFGATTNRSSILLSDRKKSLQQRVLLPQQSLLTTTKTTMSTPATAVNNTQDADFGASAAVLPEEEVEPKRSSSTSTATTDKDQGVDYNGLYADVGFLFEGQQATEPTRVETFEWNNLPDGRSITVQCRCVVQNNQDNENVAPARPGASSGHYLWPAARHLAEYLVQQVQKPTTGNSTICNMNPPTTVVELGAGCALLSCVALQLWQPTLECIVVTDHDAAALERARDNYETTLQALLDRSTTEEDLNAAINATASICFQFCALPWGTDTRPVRAILGEHSVRRRANVILGSDLLYDTAVVQPLLQTAKDLLATHGVFYLAQSYNLDDADVDAAVTIACVSLGLVRQTLVDGSRKESEGFSIQAFTLRDEVEYSASSYDEGDATPTPSPTASSSSSSSIDKKDNGSSRNN